MAVSGDVDEVQRGGQSEGEGGELSSSSTSSLPSLSQAPGEAEAELAYLSSEGRLDAVQTEDVDALVFGAAVVYMRSVCARREDDDELAN